MNLYPCKKDTGGTGFIFLGGDGYTWRGARKDNPFFGDGSLSSDEIIIRPIVRWGIDDEIGKLVPVRFSFANASARVFIILLP